MRTKGKTTTPLATTRVSYRELLQQNYQEAPSHAQAPDQVWLSDITYLWTTEGWLYVCCVLDLFTRRIVGWSMASHMTSQLVLGALDMAYAKRHPAGVLIFHSDRGSQICEPRCACMAESARHAPIDERHRQLLRQRADGKLLALAESRGDTWTKLRHP